MKRSKRSLGFLLAPLLALGLCGCPDGNSGKTGVTAVPLEERVKAIEAREDMPPQAKAMAIQQLKAGEAASQSRAGAQNRNEKK